MLACSCHTCLSNVVFELPLKTSRQMTRIIPSHTDPKTIMAVETQHCCVSLPRQTKRAHLLTNIVDRSRPRLRCRILWHRHSCLCFLVGCTHSRPFHDLSSLVTLSRAPLLREGWAPPLPLVHESHNPLSC